MNPLANAYEPHTNDGARTNSKVGEGKCLVWSAGKKVFVVSLRYLGTKNTISRFGECFRDCQYSLVSFLFAVLLLTVHRAPMSTFIKVGARAPSHPCPMESAPLHTKQNSGCTLDNYTIMLLSPFLKRGKSFPSHIQTLISDSSAIRWRCRTNMGPSACCMVCLFTS